jgi:hypothetical protein
MAIIKQAKNVKVIVKGNFSVIATKIVKDADEIIIDATSKNLTFNGAKKIITNGNRS